MRIIKALIVILLFTSQAWGLDVKVPCLNLPSSDTVQFYQYDIDDATLDLNWVSTGVTEVANGDSTSTYYKTLTFDAGHNYIVNCRTTVASPTQYAKGAFTALETSVDGLISTRAAASTALSNATWTDTKAGYVDAAISGRLATAGYTAPDNASISAIKAKTDNLPSDPASNTQVATRASQTSVNAIPTNPTLQTTWTDAKAGYLTGAVALDSTVAKAATVALQATLTTLIPEAIPFTSHKVDANATATVDNAAVADAVWDEALSGHTTAGTSGLALSTASAAGDPWSVVLGSYGAGTAGKIVYDNLNATVSSRPTLAQIEASNELLRKTGGSTTNLIGVSADNKVNANAGILDSDKTEIAQRTWNSSYAATRILTSGANIADDVWDELLSGHTVSGSAGYSLNAAASAGDPWSTLLPGAYGAGTAGYIIGTTVVGINSQTTKLKFNTFNDLWCISH